MLTTANGEPGRQRRHFADWETWAEQFDTTGRLTLRCVSNGAMPSFEEGFIAMLRGGGDAPAGWPAGVLLRGDIERSLDESTADAVRDRIPELLQRRREGALRTATSVRLEAGTEPGEHGWTALDQNGHAVGRGRAKAYWNAEEDGGTLEVFG